MHFCRRFRLILAQSKVEELLDECLSAQRHCDGCQPGREVHNGEKSQEEEPEPKENEDFLQEPEIKLKII